MRLSPNFMIVANMFFVKIGQSSSGVTKAPLTPLCGGATPKGGTKSLFEFGTILKTKVLHFINFTRVSY